MGSKSPTPVSSDDHDLGTMIWSVERLTFALCQYFCPPNLFCIVSRQAPANLFCAYVLDCPAEYPEVPARVSDPAFTLTPRPIRHGDHEPASRDGHPRDASIRIVHGEVEQAW